MSHVAFASHEPCRTGHCDNHESGLPVACLHSGLADVCGGRPAFALLLLLLMLFGCWFAGRDDDAVVVGHENFGLLQIFNMSK
eukprot:3207255-Amphidinium_carterae.1